MSENLTIRSTTENRQPLNRRQRKSKKNRRYWLERLTEMWPQGFDLKTPRPLAVGIMDAITSELNAPGAGGHGAPRYALKSHTSNIVNRPVYAGYLQSVALSHSSRAGISARCRSFAPGWAVCTPPVQPDCCARSGNYQLESNPERHAKTPLAAATGN